MDTPTYCVTRHRYNDYNHGTVLVRGLATIEEAAAVALRLHMLQENELGGRDEFCASEE